MAAKKVDRLEPRVVIKGGADLVNIRPIFSIDCKYLLIASGFVIKVISVRSGECVKELKGHQARITCMELVPRNRYQVLSCSADKTVIKWDFTDGAMLKKYTCRKPLYSLISTGLPNPAFLGLMKFTEREHGLVQFSLVKSQTNIVFKTLEKLSGTDQNVSFGCGNEVIACISGKSLIVRSNLKEQRRVHEWECPLKQRERDGKEMKLTCVACHPTEYCVATGTSIGSIDLWYNIFSKKKVKTTVHWHALPVLCLNFTMEGSYMLSGGFESVLVKWQHNSKHRDTLPRLGSPIIKISCSKDNMYYATSHADNSIQIINNHFMVTQVIAGLTLARLDKESKHGPIPVGLLIDPRTEALVLNGTPGHLQFYDLDVDKQIYCVDIVGQNFISPENLQRPLVMTEVSKSAFSSDGRWLVTTEWRDDKLTFPEQRLKFWLYNDKEQTYILNTTVEQPHEDRVDLLKFRPQLAELDDQLPCVVTSSRDGKFKVWQIVDDSDIYTTRSCWSCESVGYYRKESANAMDFSEDGSLLAVVFGNTVTFWNPDSNSLQKTLPLHEEIREILFGKGSCSHLLVLATSKRLIVWNLLTFSAEWMAQVEAKVVCIDPLSGLLATFSPDLKVFRLSEKKPVYEQSKISTSAILAAVFVPNRRPNKESGLPWGSYSQLYFLNAEQRLMVISEELVTSEESIEDETTAVRIKETLPETPFSILLSHKQKPQLNADNQTDTRMGRPGATYLKEMLDTPAHVLPPVRTLCMSFMEKLMLNKSAFASEREEEEEEDDSEANDSDSDSDSDMEVDSPAAATIQTESNTGSQPTQISSDLSVTDYSWITADNQ